MSGLRFVEKLASSPWLCDPGHVEFLHSIFLRYMDRVASGGNLDVQSVEQAIGRPLDNTRSVTNKEGVARIPVEGTIMRRANLFTQMSGGVSTETLAKDFITAYNDASVHSIVFVFDTPGGEAYGINELATLIREKRDEGTKRIEAFCDGLCASAGYYLASATERITAEVSSSVGSIGTAVRVFNPQAAGKSPYLEFVNARSPNKRPDPNTAAGRTAIQDWIDDMGDQFIQFVAEARGVTFEKVEQDFGQGFIMTGRRALEAGMVDALGSEGEVVGRLQQSRGVVRLRVAASSEYATGGLVATQPVPVVLSEARNITPNTEEVAAQMSESVTQSVPSIEEKRTEGFMAHMRAFFLGGDSPSTAAQETDETREDMAETTTTEDTTATDEGSEVVDLRAELEEERRKNAELERTNTSLVAQVQALAGENAEKAEVVAEQKIDAELAAYCGEGKGGGVPPWQAQAARPDLLEAAQEPENAAAQERAKRWRTVLDGAVGTVEFGERGTGEGRGAEEMTDDDRVKATLKERGLGMESYSDVAAELAGQGEIRRSDSGQ